MFSSPSTPAIKRSRESSSSSLSSLSDSDGSADEDEDGSRSASSSRGPTVPATSSSTQTAEFPVKRLQCDPPLYFRSTGNRGSHLRKVHVMSEIVKIAEDESESSRDGLLCQPKGSAG